MSQRHPIQNDAIMFVTTNIRHKQPIFSNEACATEAVETLYRVQQLHPFFLYGFVVMPDHCHFLLKVMAPYTISKLMSTYKSNVALNIGMGNIWQERFHIRLPNKPEASRTYIHTNPVKAGIIEHANLYPWSSASAKWDVSPIEIF